MLTFDATLLMVPWIERPPNTFVETSTLVYVILDEKKPYAMTWHACFIINLSRTIPSEYR